MNIQVQVKYYLTAGIAAGVKSKAKREVGAISTRTYHQYVEESKSGNERYWKDSQVEVDDCKIRV